MHSRLLRAKAGDWEAGPASHTQEAPSGTTVTGDVASGYLGTFRKSIAAAKEVTGKAARVGLQRGGARC